MKKIIFLVFVALFSLNASMVFANNPVSSSESEKTAIPVKTENKLTDAEINHITKRVKEIRKMDKSELTSEEKKELKSELKEMKKEVKKSNGTIYIGGTTLLLILILVILLV
jgi:cell shape-determining protein MreC